VGRKNFLDGEGLDQSAQSRESGGTRKARREGGEGKMINLSFSVEECGVGRNIPARETHVGMLVGLRRRQM